MIKKIKFNKIISAFVICIMLIEFFNYNVLNVLATGQTGIVTGVSDYLNVRTGPSTSYNAIANLYNGDNVNVLNTVKDSSGNPWYEIEFTFGTVTKKGYVYASYIKLNSTISDADFEAYINQQGFPESYKVKLRELHELHPSWVFKAKHVGLSWANVLSAETALGKNLVPGSSVVSWKSLESGAYDWTTNIWHGFDGSWVAASKEITAYYLDPRNSLKDPYIFQFENLTYSRDIETEAGVDNILSGTFMASPSYTYTDASGKAYPTDFSSTFISAAESSGVSPYNLAASVKQEQGVNGTGQLAQGVIIEGVKYFNFFNVGAYPSGGNDSITNGAIYAKNAGWSSPSASIIGGASFLASGYISKGQDTLYLKKFDVVDGGNGFYGHQYMTNIMAAYSESSIMSNAYSSELKSTALTFSIPVYDSMPATAAAKPIGTGIVDPMGISLDKTSATIFAGDTLALSAAVLPAFSYNKSVSWTTSNAGVASVDQSGNVKGVGYGTATITAATVNGKTVKCTVTVKMHEVSVKYRTHVQSIGWQSYVADGALSGTTGRSLRLEAINIGVSGNPDLGIKYKTHVQNIGWQNYVADGALSGTTGKSLRLEAIKIELTGTDADKYDIYYRVHAQDYGWLDWAKNGMAAGTEGLSKRLEAIEIKIVARGTVLGESTAKPFVSKYGIKEITYRTHVQSIGWQGYVADGELSGTTGRALRLEAINIKLGTCLPSGSIYYSTHVQNIGWMSPVSDGALSGTTGKSLRLEAIRMNLSGETAKQFDLYYRVHVQNTGWMDWAKNGGSAGSAGFSYRLEAIEIKLVPKGAEAPGSTARPFMQK